jgi:hypothetical protein
MKKLTLEDMQREVERLVERVNSTPSSAPATTETRQLQYSGGVVTLARELYDRFVMGGWEPQDSYELIAAIFAGSTPAESGGWHEQQGSEHDSDRVDGDVSGDSGTTGSLTPSGTAGMTAYRDSYYESWREGYGEPYVRPKDAWDAGFASALAAKDETARQLRASLSDLVIEMQKHSNDHLRDEDATIRAQAAVEGVCADRIAALLDRTAPGKPE